MSAALALQPLLATVALREGCEADHALVYSTWIRHYRRHSADAQRVPERTYLVEQHELIRGLLGRSQLLCAVDSQEPGVVLGYVVSGDRALHWLHVKAGFRGLGLARLLAGRVEAPLYYSHAIDAAAGLCARLGLALAYNPYRAWLP